MKHFIGLVAAVALMANAYGQAIGTLTIDTLVGSGLRGDGGPATSAQLLSPTSVALDAAGNLYIADIGIVRKVTTDGNITTFAGAGIAGFSGDGGRAVDARLGNTVAGLTVDAGGNVYIADTSNNRVRQVTPDGIINTVAGNGTAGFQGDGGPPAAARLNQPYAVVIDNSGALYVSDTNNHRIRKVAAGAITTVAGTGTAGFNGDGANASALQLNFPAGLSLDSSGNLYIADQDNHRIRKLTPAGAISTVAGNGVRGTTTTASPLTSSFQFPTDVLVGPSGELYIGDRYNHVVRVVGSSGSIKIAAGTTVGFSGDGKPATFAQLNYPRGMAMDASGTIYLADQNNRRVRQVTPAGVINTVVGVTGADETALSAELGFPQGLAVAGGNLYFTDTANNIVRQIALNGALTTIAGTGINAFAGDAGPAGLSQLAQPAAVAADSAGNVYIADTLNHRIRQVTPGGVINTVAGSGATSGFSNAQPYDGDGGPATSASLFFPRGVALDGNGNIYISDTSNQRIRKITRNGMISTIAGTGAAGFSGDGGLATQAQLNNPIGIAVDVSGNIYIADTTNHRIRKITSGGVISTVAGTGTANFSGDGGPAIGATLRFPRGVKVDSAGNIYIADTNNARIRKITPAGIISTIAGTGGTSFVGDGGPATQGQFFPFDVALDADGTLYVPDYNNQRIRILQAARITPSTVLNFASNLPGAIAPGELLTINGSGIGPADLMTAQADGAGLIETTLGLNRVLFDGVPAAILDAQGNQLHVVAPYALAGKTTTRLQVEYQGKKTNAVALRVADTAPGVLTQDGSGKGQAVISNADGSANAPGNGATAGSVVTISGTGEGQTNPAGVDGLIASGALAQPIAPVSVQIGGMDAPVVAYGAVPNAVAGSFQVSVTVPAGVTTGDTVPVVLTVGSASSQPGVTMALQ